MNQIVLNKFKQLILGSHKILVLSHQKPDGDSVGSVLALSKFIKAVGKQCDVFTLGPASSSFDFLYRGEDVITSAANLSLNQYDLIIILDCGDFKQTGIKEELEAIQNKIPIINIDHHKTNEFFGKLNIVFPETSSTSEIIFDLFRKFEFPIDKNIATYLLTGLITDTSNFSNPATTFSSLEAASFLLKSGARISEIYANVWNNKSIAVLKFWGEILSRLRENKRFNLATTVITHEDLKVANLTEEALEGVTNFLNSLKGIKIVLVLKTIEPGKIKGSLRTTVRGVDGSRLAKIFGGGGHKKAAGFTIEGNLVKIGSRWRIE